VREGSLCGRADRTSGLSAALINSEANQKAPGHGRWFGWLRSLRQADGSSARPRVGVRAAEGWHGLRRAAACPWHGTEERSWSRPPRFRRWLPELASVLLSGLGLGFGVTNSSGHGAKPGRGVLSQLRREEPVLFAACVCVKLFSARLAVPLRSGFLRSAGAARAGRGWRSGTSSQSQRGGGEVSVTWLHVSGHGLPWDRVPRRQTKKRHGGNVPPACSCHEARAGLVCPQPGWKPAPFRPSIPPHPHPLLGCFRDTPQAGGSSPGGLQLGLLRRGDAAKGPFALAGLTLPHQLSEIPGRLCQPPCPPRLALTPQLTSWLLYIYFLPPPHPSPSPCLSQKQQRRPGSSSVASRLRSPAKHAGLQRVLPGKPCLHPPNVPCSPPGRGTGSALVPGDANAVAAAGASCSSLAVCAACEAPAESGDGAEGRTALAVADGQMFCPDAWPSSAVREARSQGAARDAPWPLPGEQEPPRGSSMGAWFCNPMGDGRSQLFTVLCPPIRQLGAAPLPSLSLGG